jgi:hypothetical protein
VCEHENCEREKFVEREFGANSCPDLPFAASFQWLAHLSGKILIRVVGTIRLLVAYFCPELKTIAVLTESNLSAQTKMSRHTFE